MFIAVVTLFPEMFSAIEHYGVGGRAIGQAVVSLKCVNPREFTEDRHQTVDDRPYGGGPGMVMKIAPLEQAVAAAQNWLLEQSGTSGRVIYLSPQGQTLTQERVKDFSAQRQNLVLVAGRYEGIDERFIEAFVDEEISIGDYVLSGGELPAMVLIDALTRMLPGALGDEQSAEQDSFTNGLLDCPHYTRPPVYQGREVPKVLLSGDHQKIRQWRLQQSLVRTGERRPDLLNRLQLDEEQTKLLRVQKNAKDAD